MKTNQLLTVEFSLGSFDIEHKTLMGDLHQIFDLGNKYRASSGLTPITLSSWRVRPSVLEYIEVLKNKGIETPVRTKRGRGRNTYAHLHLILMAAQDLDASFRYEVQQTFIDARLTHFRDISGDMYLEMNASLADAALSVLGKPAHRGHFINIAKIIKNRLNVEDWNNCSPAKLAERVKIEDHLAIMLKANVVKNWEHLKELAKIV